MSAAAMARASRLTDGRTQAWIELRFARSALTVAELHGLVSARARASERQVYGWVLQWAADGHLVAQGKPCAYRMTEQASRLADPPVRPRKPRAEPKHWTERRPPRHRLWSAMRVLKRFDMVTLSLSADTNEARTRDFLRIVERAGYVRAVAVPSGAPRWATGARHLGPKPPRVENLRIAGRPVMRVTDRNDGSVVDVLLRPHRQDRLALEGDVGGEG